MLNPFKKQIIDVSSSTTLALQHGQFISRIFTDTSGQQFRLTFFVTMVDGEARGHLISAQPMKRQGQTLTSLLLTGSCAPSSQAFCLPISAHKKELETAYIPSYTPIVSPFTELYFFTSQPTRAPSYK